MSSLQLRRFEVLFDSLATIGNYLSEMDKRFAHLRLIEQCNVLREEIERNIELCKEGLLLDIDTDFSYSELAMDSRWHNQPYTEIQISNDSRSTYGILKNDLCNSEYLDKTFGYIFNEIDEADKKRLSNNIKIAKSENKEIIKKSELLTPEFVSSLDVDVFKRVFLDVSSTLKIADHALMKITSYCFQELRKAVMQLGAIMDEHPAKMKCERLYDEQTGIACFKLKGNAGKIFNDWADIHMEEDEKNLDLLNDYKEDVVVEILKLDFLEKVPVKTTRLEAKDHKNDLDFDEICGEDAEKYRKKYCQKFLSLFKCQKNKKYIEYTPNKHYIGEYLYLSRNKYSIDKRNDFYVKLFLLERIQNVMFNKNANENKKNMPNSEYDVAYRKLFNSSKTSDYCKGKYLACKKYYTKPTDIACFIIVYASHGIINKSQGCASDFLKACVHIGIIDKDATWNFKSMSSSVNRKLHILTPDYKSWKDGKEKRLCEDIAKCLGKEFPYLLSNTY